MSKDNSNIPIKDDQHNATPRTDHTPEQNKSNTQSSIPKDWGTSYNATHINTNIRKEQQSQWNTTNPNDWKTQWESNKKSPDNYNAWTQHTSEQKHNKDWSSSPNTTTSWGISPTSNSTSGWNNSSMQPAFYDSGTINTVDLQQSNNTKKNPTNPSQNNVTSTDHNKETQKTQTSLIYSTHDLTHSEQNWIENNNTLSNDKYMKTHDTTHTTVTNSTISSKPETEIDLYSLNDQDSLTPISYPIYIDCIIHHDKEHEFFPRKESIKESTMAEILSKMLKGLEESHNLQPLTIHSCYFNSTSKRNKRNNDLHSVYNITVSSSNQYVTYDECNQTMDILYNYLWSNEHKSFQLTQNASDLAKRWAPFISYKLPNVNCENDKSYGYLIGIYPDFHGKHHVACKWILSELYEITRKYFPSSFECHNMAQFRSKVGVRGGPYTVFQTTHQIYHIHTKTREMVTILTNCLAAYQAEYNKPASIFNRAIIIDDFPDKRNHGEIKNLTSRIMTSQRLLKAVTEIKIHRPITKTNLKPVVEKIQDIEDLYTYAFRHQNNIFHISIFLSLNPRTAGLRVSDFLYIFNENEDENNNLKSSPLRLNFPSQEDSNTQKRKALFRHFDDSISGANEDIPPQKSFLRKKAKKYYGVRRGFRTGMFYTWQQTEQAIKHYRNAVYQSFNTEENAADG